MRVAVAWPFRHSWSHVFALVICVPCVQTLPGTLLRGKRAGMQGSSGGDTAGGEGGEDGLTRLRAVVEGLREDEGEDEQDPGEIRTRLGDCGCTAVTKLIVERPRSSLGLLLHILQTTAPSTARTTRRRRVRSCWKMTWRCGKRPAAAGMLLPPRLQAAAMEPQLRTAAWPRRLPRRTLTTTRCAT